VGYRKAEGQGSSLRVVEGPHGLFVAPPQFHREKATQLDIAQPMRAELRKIFEPRILAEYRTLTGDDMA
jgi:DNA-binding cell septation regulator SpoVG